MARVDKEQLSEHSLSFKFLIFFFLMWQLLSSFQKNLEQIVLKEGFALKQEARRQEGRQEDRQEGRKVTPLHDQVQHFFICSHFPITRQRSSSLLSHLQFRSLVYLLCWLNRGQIVSFGAKSVAHSCLLECLIFHFSMFSTQAKLS